MPSVLFALVIKVYGLAFCSNQPGQWPYCCILPAITELVSTNQKAQLLSNEMGSCNLFCSGWLGIVILPISASQIIWDDRHAPPHMTNLESWTTPHPHHSWSHSTSQPPKQLGLKSGASRIQQQIFTFEPCECIMYYKSNTLIFKL
jgi:hypothetical protein